MANTTEHWICALLMFAFTLLAYFCYNKNNSSPKKIPRMWPIVGMLPGLLQNAHRIHEFATDILRESGGTFELKGPVFTKLDMLVTCDPANVHHILSRNFSNYPKGSHFREIFDVLGDGIFNVDGRLWELHRKITLSFVNHAHFYTLLQTTVWNKVEEGLLPVLDSFAERGAEFDLQEIFQRFTFDTISKLVLNNDPKSLCIDMPYVPCEKAFNHMVDALLYRHILPRSFWKLQKWLGVGKEKNLIRACQAFDQFIYSSITGRNDDDCSRLDEDLLSLFNAYAKAYQEQEVVVVTTSDSMKFLRDAFLNLMLAGRDTTSTTLTWLFWLLAKNPLVQAKVRDEIEEKLDLKQELKVEECRKLVYLHGALCESLRLFPPVALEHKVPEAVDVLPSGHRAELNTRMILSFYSMGRMDAIWGEDCMEFRPERWISRDGGIKHEPSYKFPAFNAGPRTCLGKEMSFVQMKMIVAIILNHYDFQVVDSNLVSPSDSIILQVKHGLKVKFSQRNAR